MKRLTLILPLIALVGCASTVALKDDTDATRAVGTLTLAWLHPDAMEVMLDGKRHVGEWERERCFDPECQGTYRNVPKVHRRHITKGQATLKTKDGDRLECQWVSHLPDVQGTCRAQDGRVFRLVENNPTK